MSRVRGPTSALTEFLKERGIRAPAASRYQRIERSAPEASEAASEAATDTPEEVPPAAPAARFIAPGASMQFEEEEEGEAPPLPPKRPKSVRAGERVACGRCGKTFSATRYTRMDPALGALCLSCKQTVPPPATGRKAPKRTPRKPGNVVEMKPVLPTLQALSINVIAQHIESLQGLGGLSARNVDAISQLISKNRRLTDQTMQLFLTRATQRLALYDCSAVTSAAFQTVPHFAPHIHTLVLQMCGQLDNAAFAALGRLPLVALDLYGPYLVRKEAWIAFLESRGGALHALRLRETPRFDYACIATLVARAPQLRELGLAQIGGLDDASARLLCGLRHLVYLDLSQPGVSAHGVPPGSLHASSVVPILATCGPQLTTLRLDGNAELGDELADVLATCRALRVLSVNGARVSSAAWAQCFAAMGTTPLEDVSLSHNGLKDAAVTALFHAAPQLRVLRLEGNDALTPAAFEVLADAAPPLTLLEVSFVRCIDDAVLCRLTTSLRSLATLYVFGCNRVTPDFVCDRLALVGRERAPVRSWPP